VLFGAVIVNAVVLTDKVKPVVLVTIAGVLVKATGKVIVWSVEVLFS
jgi:hypothetical protein